MDITIVVKHYQIWTCFITGSLEQNWSFCYNTLHLHEAGVSSTKAQT